MSEHKKVIRGLESLGIKKDDWKELCQIILKQLDNHDSSTYDFIVQHGEKYGKLDG